MIDLPRFVFQCVLSKPGGVCTTRLEEGNANRFRFPVLSVTDEAATAPPSRPPPRPRPPPPSYVDKQTVCLPPVCFLPPSLASFHKPNPIPCLVNGRFSLLILRNEWRKRRRRNDGGGGCRTVAFLHPREARSCKSRSLYSAGAGEGFISDLGDTQDAPRYSFATWEWDTRIFIIAEGSSDTNETRQGDAEGPSRPSSSPLRSSTCTYILHFRAL